MPDKARFLKKNWWLELGPKGPKLAQNEVFHHFREFGSLVFLEIAYSDSLQQCLTASRGKTYKIKFGNPHLTKQAKIGPKIRFFAIFSSLVH